MPWSKKNMISKLKYSFKIESQTFQDLLSGEIDDLGQKTSEIIEKHSTCTDEIAALRSGYNRSEIQIVGLQYTLETLKGSLKSHELEKNELENLNDHWEQSIRSLEFYNNSLESQFSSTQETVLTLHTKVNNIVLESKEEYKDIKNKCEALKNKLNRARSPSPIVKSSRPPMFIMKQHVISIEQKVILENHSKIVIVAGPSMYVNDTTVVVSEKKQGKMRFEFNKVVKKDEMCEAVFEVLEQVNEGGNGCIFNYSSGNRRQSMVHLLQRVFSLLAHKESRMQISEIIEERLINLLPSQWETLQIDSEIAEIYLKAAKNISKGRSHLLVTLKSHNSVLQILDLAKVNDDQSLLESLSINASIFYLEELMMNLNKNVGNPFEKTILTKQLEASLQSSYFALFLLHCENAGDLPILTFGARLQQIFLGKKYNNTEIDRTLALLQRERNSNLAIMRLIEKVAKDTALMKKVSGEKDEKIKMLSGKNPLKVTSLSPSSLRAAVQSRIPLPKPLKPRSKMG